LRRSCDNSGQRGHGIALSAFLLGRHQPAEETLGLCHRRSDAFGIVGDIEYGGVADLQLAGQEHLGQSVMPT